MKHLKIFEAYRVENNDVIITIGDYIKLSSTMPVNIYTDKQYLGSKVREIYIYIGETYCGSIRIDERKFNKIGDSFSPQPIIENKYLKNLTKKIKEYLFLCHAKMKKSNPDYGLYGTVVNGKTIESDGKISLYVHEFFDYVENDFVNSNSELVNEIKFALKQIKYMLDAEKYNL